MSDDEEVQLSSAALAALAEFRAEKVRKEEDLLACQSGHSKDVKIDEDWQLSQFWYDDSTARRLVKEAVSVAMSTPGDHVKNIACVSSPTLMSFFHETEEYKEGRIAVKVFEYDTRFGLKFPTEYVFYDYKQPTSVPDELKGLFDVVIADPPFLAAECLIKTSHTIRLIGRNDVRIIVCTGAVMEDLASGITRISIFPARVGCESDADKVHFLLLIFDKTTRAPVNLACGHVVCKKCVQSLNTKTPCSHDDAEAKVSVHEYPVNVALLTIITGEAIPSRHVNPCKRNLEDTLIGLAGYLKKTDSERGGSVYSKTLSRMLQRKLVALLCYQYEEEDGRSRALKACRAMAERIMSEVLLGFQSSGHVSSELWTAVRSRGCQFLGPAMQEDVLKLILVALSDGDAIARKTLVMYVVTMLSDDYPQVSKTCVGHVVQLLYRASCFHVLKREGESSLMKLKEEFRTLDTLRREHDAQIVQMAMETGLRISPDQWSALLYADQAHRSHMQSIIDKLQSTTSAYSQHLEEFMGIPRPNPTIEEMIPLLRNFEKVHPTHYEKVDIQHFHDHLQKISMLIVLYVEYEDKRREERQRAPKSERVGGFKFKTKMCLNIRNDRKCVKGQKCNYAHSPSELRPATTPAEEPPVPVPRQQPPQQQQQPRHQPAQQRPTAQAAHQQSHTNGFHQPHNSMPMQYVPLSQPPPQPASQTVQQQHTQSLPLGGMVQRGPPQPPPPQWYSGQQFSHTIGPNFNGVQPVMQPVPMVQSQPTGRQTPVMVDPRHHHLHHPPRPAPITTPMAPMVVGYPHPPPTPIPAQFPPAPPAATLTAPPAPATQPQSVVQMLPVLMPSPTHNKTAQMVMVPSDSPMIVNSSGLPPPTAAVAAAAGATGPAPAQTPPPPHPSSLWTSSTQLLIPSSPPHQNAPIWIPNQSMFPIDTFDGSAFVWSDGSNAAGPLRDNPQDADQLLMKRNEIINRLAPLSIDEDDGDDNGISHVSYMVASSVLDDTRVEMHPFMVMKGGQPAFVNFAPIPTNEESINMIQRPRAASLTQGTLVPIDTTTPTTATEQPTGPIVSCPPAEVVVGSQPQTTVLVDGSGNILAPVQIIMAYPQGLVSNSLDKIVDVKERLCEAEQGSASEEVSEHLRMELRMAESEMEHLDPRTKTNCLLRELHQVDMELHQLHLEERGLEQ